MIIAIKHDKSSFFLVLLNYQSTIYCVFLKNVDLISFFKFYKKTIKTNLNPLDH